MNKFLEIYGWNCCVTIFLIVLKVFKVIDCNIIICLLPVLLITFFIGLVMIIMGKEIVKKDLREKKNNY